MWRSRSDRDGKSVVCIACGTSVLRTEAREYDKEGDRWSRQGKEFEHVCKSCHGELCHQSRDGLEELATEARAPDGDRESFLRRYLDAAAERDGSPDVDADGGDR